MRIYIVVVPRNSLIQDLYNRSKELKLDSIVFNRYNKDSLDPLEANLIFINIELFSSIEFFTYLYKLKEVGLDITILFNEVHLLVLEEDFREQLRDIDKILKFKIQLVFISATLPINLLDLLELKFLLNNNLIIREETSRKNISYIKVPIYPNNNFMDYIKEIIKKQITKLEDKEKIIIFCNNKEKVREIAKELRILYYYSSKDIEEQKELESNLSKFLDSNNKEDFIIVTTIALSIGINYPYIKVSIYIPTISSLVNII